MKIARFIDSSHRPANGLVVADRIVKLDPALQGTARDIQLQSPTMMLGKSFDTHGPIGPWLVTTGEILDPQRLLLRTWVNGELRQSASTSEMHYPISDQIAELTSIFTLEPGDILTTSTPAGIGAAMDPPRFLQAGDVVRVEIEGIGSIENRCVVDATPTWSGQ